jgi:amidohydrolase
MNLVDPILSEAAGIRALRRDIHSHPELGFQEQRTSDLIAETLTDWNIPIHRGLGTTGVVGIVNSGNSNRAVGLRADIDALPILEHNTFSHASVYRGRMHACGHDGHAAMLLAAAKHLATHRNFDGTVYLIFKPAEEGGSGAREMIKEGIFQLFPMEALFGIHNWPGLDVGQFAIRSGPSFASSNDFKITIMAKAHTRRCHTTASTRFPWPVRWCKPSRPSSPAINARSTRASSRSRRFTPEKPQMSYQIPASSRVLFGPLLWTCST